MTPFLSALSFLGYSTLIAGLFYVLMRYILEEPVDKALRVTLMCYIAFASLAYYGEANRADARSYKSVMLEGE